MFTQTPKQPAVESKEQKIIESYRKVWTKPFEQVIDEFLEYKPEAIAPLHLRMRKGDAKDLNAAKERIKSFKLINEPVFEHYLPQLILLRILTKYLQLADEKQDHSKLSQEMKKTVLSKTYKIFNPFPDSYDFDYIQETLTKNDPLPLSKEEFYLRTNESLQYDLWDMSFAGDHSEEFSFHMISPNDRSRLPLSELQSEISEDRSYNTRMNPYASYIIGLKNEIANDLFSINFNVKNLSDENILLLGEDNVNESHTSQKIIDSVNEDVDISTAIKGYRNAVAFGSTVALTGLARLYAQGLCVETDIDFAIQLYRMAIDDGVLGALPCNINNSTILFYSCIASGFNVDNPRNYSHLTFLRGIHYVETEWLMEMTTADRHLRQNLKKFKTMALEEPELFDRLLKTIKEPIKRLSYCFSGETLNTILVRNKLAEANPSISSATQIGTTESVEHKQESKASDPLPTTTASSSETTLSSSLSTSPRGSNLTQFSLLTPPQTNLLSHPTDNPRPESPTNRK